MQLDELVLQGTSRRDDVNYWLIELGRVEFAALNRGVFLFCFRSARRATRRVGGFRRLVVAEGARYYTCYS
jgi:hypothetical protein